MRKKVEFIVNIDVERLKKEFPKGYEAFKENTKDNGMLHTILLVLDEELSDGYVTFTNGKIVDLD